MDYKTERELRFERLAQHQGLTIALSPLGNNYHSVETVCSECDKTLWVVFTALEPGVRPAWEDHRVRLDLVCQLTSRYNIYAGICPKCGTLYWTHYVMRVGDRM